MPKLIYNEDDAIYAFEVLRDLVEMSEREPSRVTRILADLQYQDQSTDLGFLPVAWNPCPKTKGESARINGNRKIHWISMKDQPAPKDGSEVLLAIPAYGPYPDMIILDQWLEIHPTLNEPGWFNFMSSNATHWAHVTYPREGW